MFCLYSKNRYRTNLRGILNRKETTHLDLLVQYYTRLVSFLQLLAHRTMLNYLLFYICAPYYVEIITVLELNALERQRRHCF